MTNSEDSVSGDRHPTVGTARGESSPVRWLVGLILLAVAFVGAAVVLSQVFEREGQTHTITIPLGTSERLDAGEDVELIPENLRFTLQDRLVITNNDVAFHQVGPFTVGPGETVDQTFGEVATFEGLCSLHPSGSVSIEITSG